MLLKRIELLLDPRIEKIAFVVKYEGDNAEYDDDNVRLHKLMKVNDGDRVEIYEGLKVSRRTLED